MAQNDEFCMFFRQPEKGFRHIEQSEISQLLKKILRLWLRMTSFVCFSGSLKMFYFNQRRLRYGGQGCPPYK